MTDYEIDLKAAYDLGKKHVLEQSNQVMFPYEIDSPFGIAYMEGHLQAAQDLMNKDNLNYNSKYLDTKIIVENIKVIIQKNGL